MNEKSFQNFFLKSPIPYAFLQYALGAHRLDAFLKDHIKKISDLVGIKLNILDIGCGEGRLAKTLSEAGAYIGVDSNVEYIERAKRINEGKGAFYCEDVSKALTRIGDTPTVALMIGVLHHLDDSTCISIINALTDNESINALITVDPFFWDNQSFLPRLIARLDRGNYVRDLPHHMSLFPNQTTNFYMCRYSTVPSDSIVCIQGIHKAPTPNFPISKINNY